MILAGFLPKSQNRAKVIVFFLEKQEEIIPWFYNIWIALWLKLFCTAIYFSRFRPSSGRNGGSKLDQKCKLWVSPVSVKIWIFPRFLKHTFSILKYYLWWKFHKSQTIFRVVRAKRAISWMLNWYEKFWKFLTWQPQMLYSWNLPRLCIFMRPSIWQKIEACLIGRKRA